MAAIFYALSTLKTKLGDKERGATAVEYGIMVAAIAVVIIVAVIALGGQLNGMFEGVTDQIEGIPGAEEAG